MLAIRRVAVRYGGRAVALLLHYSQLGPYWKPFKAPLAHLSEMRLAWRPCAKHRVRTDRAREREQGDMYQATLANGKPPKRQTSLTVRALLHGVPGPLDAPRLSYCRAIIR